MKEKLSNYLKLSYGFADMGFIFMVTMSNMYLLMFYTNVAGFSAATAGTIMVVGRIIDSISPPIIGALIEKLSLPWGKYRSWLIMGAPLILIFNTVLFMVYPVAMPYKAILACVIYAAFCISTNISYIGYTSLNSSLTDDPKERVQLSMFRGQGNALGKSLSGFAILPMIAFFGSGEEISAKGFLWTALIAGVFLLLLYGNLAYATRGRDVKNEPVNHADPKTKKLSVVEMVKLVVTTGPLILLFFADILRITCSLVISAVFPYFFKYVVNNLEGVSFFFGITSILAFIGASCVPFITKRLSKRNAYICGNLVLVVTLILAAVFSSNYSIIIVLISIGYIGAAWGNVVNTSMYADTVDYCEWKTGKNARGLNFSLFQLSIKIAAVISTGVAGFGLSIVGFDVNVEPTASVISGIRFMSMGLPAALLLGSAVLLLFYKLSDKRMAEIRAELKERSSQS